MSLQEEIRIRKREEELLTFDHFSNEDALALGLLIIEKAHERGAAVAIEIIVNEVVLFRHIMTGANGRNALWVRRKENTVRMAQISTLHAMQFMEENGLDLVENWRLPKMEYADIGGGFPITIQGTGIIGAVAVSGLPHTEDHKLIIDAISAYLGVSLEG